LSTGRAIVAASLDTSPVSRTSKIATNQRKNLTRRYSF
jgi:hypothetical protein